MNIQKFQNIIWNHYRARKKEYDFPWRRTRDPYKVLVSEVMLQQTQIPRVVPKYNEWVKTFPTPKSLARAPFRRTLSLWQGLGYNRRARFLKSAAEKIVKDFGGKIPRDPPVLQTLPGIGHYTARAVACFAHGKCQPFLDTNIRRVFINFFFKAQTHPPPRKAAGGHGPPSRKATDGHSTDWTRTYAKNHKIHDAQILALIKKAEPKSNTREWYLALMDYGRETLGRGRQNPNKKSASYRKQSPFKGSRRYVRAKIISLLNSRSGGLSFSQIKKALTGDPEVMRYKKEMSFILLALKKERLVEKKGASWSIAA